jgi:phosphate:Na+ symporter
LSAGAFEILGGLGLFFYGLRTLLRRFESFASTRIRPHLQRAFSNPIASWCWGVAFTVVSQSSNLSVISLMGLVDIGFVSLRSAYFAVLGASAGSAAELWLLLSSWHLGPMLVAAGALGLLLSKTEYWEEINSAVLSVGLALMGLEILYSGVSEIFGSSLQQRVLTSLGSIGLREQLSFFFLGTTLGLILQSAAAPVVLLLAVVNSSALTLATTTALHLGASAGLTLTPLMLSLRSGVQARRLAWAHLITRGVGVAGALFVFPTYLSVVERIATWTDPQPSLLTELVIAQLLFTLFNSLVFGLLAEPVLKILAHSLPERQLQTMGLAKRVRRMLYQDPNLAAAECHRQLRYLELEVKANYDQVMSRLTTSDPKESYRERELRERNFRSLKFTIHDLLFSVDRHRPGDHQRGVVILSLLEYFGAASRTLFHLEDHYEKGLSKKFEFPVEFLAGLSRFRMLLDDVWYEILLEHPQEGVELSDQDGGAATLEEIVLDLNKRLGIEYQGYNTWLMESAGYLRLLSSDLGQVLQRQAQLRSLAEE